jgi:hypothetical protein
MCSAISHLNRARYNRFIEVEEISPGSPSPPNPAMFVIIRVMNNAGDNVAIELCLNEQTVFSCGSYLALV